MWKMIKSPLVRISFGLAMLTVAMLLVADLLGFIPDTKNAELQYRKTIAESLAVQLSTQIADQHLRSVEDTLRSVVNRNESVLSAAVRLIEGDIVSQYGDHGKYWTLKPGDKSTATQVRVPLYDENGAWGSVELRYVTLSEGNGWIMYRSSFLSVLLFMALVGFVSYLLFLKRTMRELNPDEVIPDRVRSALDTLAEGLLIIDKQGFIVFPNQVQCFFCQPTVWVSNQFCAQKTDWKKQ